MKYVYKCSVCAKELEIEHPVSECDNYTRICLRKAMNELLDCGGAMYRVLQPSMIIWKGGKPSETQ